MKVKDITSIMQPWQSLRIVNENATQLDEPLFTNEFDIKLPKADDPISQMNVISIDSSWNTIVLYVE